MSIGSVLLALAPLLGLATCTHTKSIGSERVSDSCTVVTLKPQVTVLKKHVGA